MIGVFDSSAAGLSVLREMHRRMPGRDIVFYGDTARGPYGQRSPEIAASFLSQALSRLADMGADLLVVAGHDAAACLTDDVRARFPIPVLDILTAGVVPGLGCLTPKAVGVIGPPLLESAVLYGETIRRALPGVPVFSVSAPLLEPLIEAEWLKKPETVMIVKKYLHFLKLRQVDTLVLGSNHYTQVAGVIQRKMGKRVSLVNSASFLAKGVTDYLAAPGRGDDAHPGGGVCRIVVSDVTPHLEKIAKRFYGMNVVLERL